MSKYVWVVGGSTMQLPMVEEARKRGFKTIVTDGNPSCTCNSQADIFRSISTYDVDSHITFAKHLRYTEHIDVAAVVCPGVDVGPTVSAVAETLSLRAVPYLTAKRVRDKAMMRMVTGFPHPKNTWASSNSLAYSKYWNIYPCVVKPVDNCASRGISVVNSPDELIPAITRALQLNKTGTGAVIEEMLYGIEYALDFLIVEKKAIWVNGVTRLFRHCIPRTREKLFGIESLVINPFVAPQELCDLATIAARRLWVTEGPFKMDVIYDKRYGWCVLECATRWSGGWDSSFLAPMVGRDIYSVLLDYALGLEICIPPVDSNLHAISYAPYYKPGKIVWWIKDIKEIEPNTISFDLYQDRWGKVFIRSQEEIVSLSTCADRPIFFLSRGTTPLEAFRNVHRMSKEVVPVYRSV